MSEERTNRRGKALKISLSWLIAALDLRKKLHIGDKQIIYIWAIFVGVAGAITAICFDQAVVFIQDMLTGQHGSKQMEAFSSIPDWLRITVPTVGGVLAGLTLLFTHRFVPLKATEYMEAITLGDGYVPVKPSLLRSLSAVFTIGSGAAIGREGPLVQTSAVVASAIGRYFHLSAPRLRLMVACAAASGMSAAFHTPLAGGLFVSEIVLGSLTIDFLAPLLVSSCAGYMTLSFFTEPSPIYPTINAVSLDNGTQVVLCCIVLGVVASLSAQGWLWLLKKSRIYLAGAKKWLPVRLALAGALVGLIAVQYPEIVGNGANMIRGLVNMQFSADHALILLALKVLAVAIVFGVGTVGGALTPSLTIGGMLGFLFSACLQMMGVPGEHAIAYSLVGMAAFFTTAANAPMTSLLLVIEFTMAGQMMFPLIIGVLVSYGIARLFKVESMYHDSLSNGPRSIFNKSLPDVQLKDIARKLPTILNPNDTFGTIAKTLLTDPSQVIFVTTQQGRYLGSIIAQDVLDFAKNQELAQAVLAVDVLRTDLPTLPPEMNLPEALEVFSRKNQSESLALVDTDSRKIMGVVNKTDLYLVLSEIMKREKIQ
ncbi:MAG: chloride channel protein [Akkermansia sp.]